MKVEYLNNYRRIFIKRFDGDEGETAPNLLTL